jgi:hypothetical protein
MTVATSNSVRATRMPARTAPRSVATCIDGTCPHLAEDSDEVRRFAVVQKGGTSFACQKKEELKKTVCGASYFHWALDDAPTECTGGQSINELLSVATSLHRRDVPASSRRLG